jgi:hypothetical protein
MRPQVEEQLALRLGGGHLDQAPVLQDVLVNLGLDPVQRVADQAHALVGVEALDGLHQADVALLDQVGVRQAVAQVLARGGNHQPQVRQHQLSGGFDVAGVAQLARKALLFLLRQHRQAVDGRDVGVQVAQGRYDCPRIGQRPRHGQGRNPKRSWVNVLSYCSSILALSWSECQRQSSSVRQTGRWQ